MVTVREHILRAVRDAQILPAGEVPDADELKDGVDYFNDMSAAWSGEGIDLGLSADLTENDEVDVPREFRMAFRTNLALGLWRLFRRDDPPFSLVDAADRALKAVRGATWTMADLTPDPTLLRNSLAIRG